MLYTSYNLNKVSYTEDIPRSNRRINVTYAWNIVFVYDNLLKLHEVSVHNFAKIILYKLY